MRNIVICVNIDEKSFSGLNKINDYIGDKETKITLLHVWNSRAYDYPGDMIPPFYPNIGQAAEIEQDMKNKLEEQFSSFSDLTNTQLQSMVFTSATPKIDTVEYLAKNKCDLVVCLSAKKNSLHDFFHSSFTNYLNAHAPCDVLSLRI